MLAAAQVGVHNAKRHSYGHSLIVDPWGAVLCDLEEQVCACVDVCEEEVGVAICSEM